MMACLFGQNCQLSLTNLSCQAAKFWGERNSRRARLAQLGFNFSNFPSFGIFIAVAKIFSRIVTAVSKIMTKIWWIAMELLDDDLKTINFQFLMLVREFARHHPLEAIWKFNLTHVEIERIAIMPMAELNDLANCGRAVLMLPPITKKPNSVTTTIAAALIPIPKQTQSAE